MRIKDYVYWRSANILLIRTTAISVHCKLTVEMLKLSFIYIGRWYIILSTDIWVFVKKVKNLHHYNYFLYLKIIANYRILRVTSKIVCSFLIVYCNELFHSQSLILNFIPISFTLDGGSISLLNCYFICTWRRSWTKKIWWTNLRQNLQYSFIIINLILFK